MKATCIHSPTTRIIPAGAARKAAKVTKQENGDLLVEYGNGETGILSKEDEAFQAFVVWTMVNPGCTK